MYTNFLKIATLSPEVFIGNAKKNSLEIIKYIKKVQADSVDLLVFPELALSGYTAADMFMHDKLLAEAKNALIKIKEATSDINMIVSIGLPLDIDNSVYNASAIIYRGHILGIYLKTYLPNNNEYYEKRWFTSSRLNNKKYITLDNEQVRVGSDFILNFNDFTLAAEICEDLFSVIPPSNYYALAGADVIINNSASNEIIGKSKFRKNLVLMQSSKTISTYVYASSNSLESTSDLLFSGHNIIAQNGHLIEESKLFDIEHAGYLCVDVDLDKIKHERRNNQTFADSKFEAVNIESINVEYILKAKKEINTKISFTPFLPSKNVQKRCLEIFDIQVNALYKRMLTTKSNNIVVGVSGGLDSTLALFVCAKTMDKLCKSRKNVIAITMPGFGTTSLTKDNAFALMNSLGTTNVEIDITCSVKQHFMDIGHDENLRDITYENSQARERTQILMDYANKSNAIVCGTGDLSELALGWCTYNADQMSMYNVNASIPKTLIRTLVKCVGYSLSLNNDMEKIVDAIIETPVSPELLPPNPDGTISQITEDTVGPYVLHDFFIYYTLRYGYRPTKIYNLCLHALKDSEYNYSKEEVKKWMKLFYKRFFSQQFKRNCSPDGIKVGSVSLSPRGDFRLASEVDYHSYIEEVESL